MKKFIVYIFIISVMIIITFPLVMGAKQYDLIGPSWERLFYYLSCIVCFQFTCDKIKSYFLKLFDLEK